MLHLGDAERTQELYVDIGVNIRYYAHRYLNQAILASAAALRALADQYYIYICSWQLDTGQLR